MNKKAMFDFALEQKKEWKKILFAGTGALLSPLSSQQGESIPGICHVVCIQEEKCQG